MRRRAALLGLALAGAALAAPAPRFSPTRMSPAGAPGLAALLSGDVPDRKGVGAAVAHQGFYAGEPLGAGDCSTCHPAIAAQWAASAHRFASFNNPYYAASIEAFRRERGAAASRFCAGCHDPLLLVDDTIARADLSRRTPAAQAGLPCLICHSVSGVPDRTGNGSYVLTANEVPPPGDRGPSPHGARLRPPLLGKAELCGACHKVGLGPEITRDVWLRGQNDYDAWQQSVAGGNGVAAVYRPEKVAVKRCQDCHMPLEPGEGGRLVRSHRFLAANAALPHLRGDPEQERRTAEHLRGAVTLDLVVVAPEAARDATGAAKDRAASAAPGGPTLAERVPLPRAGAVFVDAVLRNRRVGHRFPSGTNDSNEVWLEVEARAGGRALRSDTHLVRAQPVDERGRPLLRRDPQHTRGVVYDTSLSPADPQVVRYRLDLSRLPPGEIELRASLRYRKFSRAYAAFACGELPAGVDEAVRARCLEPPVSEIASARRALVVGGQASRGREPAQAAAPAQPTQQDRPEWERYLDHGLGLADGLTDCAAEALPSVRRALALAPARPEPWLGLARVELALGRTDEVLAAADRAEALRRDHPAALWLRALALYRTYRFAEARPPLERAHLLLPQDRNVLGMLARVRGLTGDPAGALRAAEQLLAIDPESEEGHYQRGLALRELGRAAEADEAERRYLFYRRPVERDQELRALYRKLDPLRAGEDTPAHTHELR